MWSKWYPHGVWAVDFEFTALPGERPLPVCVVAKEIHTGHTIRQWLWQMPHPSEPPFPIDEHALFVAFVASAELGCFRALGWPTPKRILDLAAEYKCLTSGLVRPYGPGLLGVMTHYGVDGIDAVEKKEMQTAIGNGTWQGRYTPEQILDYCESDTVALQKLLPRMVARIDLPHALFRGRYMAAVAAIEWYGTLCDTQIADLLKEHWTRIQDDLISAMDADYHVYDGRSFRADRWAAFLAERGIPWPIRDDGRLDLNDKTFREMARSYPIVSPVRELRHALSQTRLAVPLIGSDGRNRTSLWAFGSKTGRNQPKSSEYVFGSSTWMRGLIKPSPGYGVVYLDYEQQEFGIGAALSGDEKMMAAYRTGNPYIAFGIQIGALPEGATKKTHPSQHALYKSSILGVGYGMQERSLAQRIGRMPMEARDIIRAYRDTYSRFWAWDDGAVAHAMLRGYLHTRLGWYVYANEDPNPRSLQNFLMQANASDMMRVAACLATERDVEVCAVVHDAFLVYAPLDRLEEETAKMKAAMVEASRIILNGFELRVEAHAVRYPGRHMDDRGRVMWDRTMQLLAKYGALETAA